MGAVQFLSAAKVRPAELKPLGANVRSAAIANSCYAITHANLVVASEGADLALDTIRRRNPTVYGHLLSHMPEYLKALSERDASSQTVRRAREFEEVLEDVLQHDADSLPAVVALASPECEVTKLTKLPCASWTALAKHRRFPATLENVTAYLEEIGTVDPPLAQLLRSAKGIAVPRGSSETQKAEVATRILAARGTLPEPELRTMLVLSLGLEERLPAASLQPEQGKLIGLLVERCIVEDNAETLALVQSADWPTREFAISKSAEFPSFMTTAHVRADDIEPLMKSKLVSDSVKKAVLDRVDEFVPTDSRGALTAIATFADSKQVKLEIGFVSRLASARVESELILRILRPLLPQLAASQIVKVLRAMGDEFLMMAEPNGKRPKLRNTESHLALVERLEELGLVSSHAIRGKEIQVYMKRNQELVGSNNISGE